MKTLLVLVLFALAATAWAKTPQEKLREFSEACKSESGVSEESLEKVRNKEKVDDPKLKDHAFCILKKASFMDENGEFHIETIKEKFNDATNHSGGVEKLVNKCAVKKDTPQESASHFFICVHEAREKHKHDHDNH